MVSVFASPSFEKAVSLHRSAKIDTVSLARAAEIFPDSTVERPYLTIVGLAASVTVPAAWTVTVPRCLGLTSGSSKRNLPALVYVNENVAAGLRVNGTLDRRARAAQVERALQVAGLWDEVKDRLDKSPTALSGGQQQRLCIARTVAPEPEVVLLDEPTSSLDPLGTQRIEELLFHLKERFTIIIVTHNMQQAARVSDTTSFFYLGELIETGPTRDLFTTPKEAQTEAYVTGRFG